MAWNDEKVDRLRVLYAEGLSASQIAAELGGGLSRNAVIGKVHRLGMEKRGKRPPRPRKARDQGAARLKRAIKRAREAASSEIGDSIIEDEKKRLQLFAESEARCNEALGRPLISLSELSSTTCRWPIGNPGEVDFGFCGGEPVGVYCPYHQRVGTTPALAPRRPYRGD